ncbi:unnamed protein product [Candida verbasci]|uniref:Uncharacterized protein n=1 Tax=Candida verbasci TaxID=1227364 RepID=A0A9W4TRH1_9ASCO|nr:unnamed protein product [Candida verbasci]
MSSSIRSDLPDIRQEITDSEDEDDFVRKFGDINVQYIKPSKDRFWFKRPQALNFFKDGVLFRTKEERKAATTELFVDLLYVGIVANLAGEASEEATGLALLKYVLFFFPTFMVWQDVKDFTNYYYNEDLSQKVAVFWILSLLTLYINSHYALLDSWSGAALTIVPYMLCRLSLAVVLWIYSFYIPEHRVQSRIYGCTLIITSCCWLAVIFVSVRVKIGLSFAFLFLEQLCFCICYHPWLKKQLKLTMSTALNIEHEVERFSTFVTIAIGEYLYKVVATHPLGVGFSGKFARGIFLLADAYILFWIYQYGSTCRKATHPLRNSGYTAITWIYAHIPLIAALVLSADAGGELCELDIIRIDEETEEANLYGLTFYYTGGIAVSLICMFILGFVEKSRDPPDLFLMPKFFRICLRVPIGIIIVMISFAKMNTTLLMGIVTMLLGILLIYESFFGTPQDCLTDRIKRARNQSTSTGTNEELINENQVTLNDDSQDSSNKNDFRLV